MTLPFEHLKQEDCLRWHIFPIKSLYTLITTTFFSSFSYFWRAWRAEKGPPGAGQICSSSSSSSLLVSSPRPEGPATRIKGAVSWEQNLWWNVTWGQIPSPWLGNKVDFGIGLPPSTILCHSQFCLFSQGLRIWPLLRTVLTQQLVAKMILQYQKIFKRLSWVLKIH